MRRSIQMIATCAAAVSANLSGTIKLPDGTGLGGVAVSLSDAKTNAVVSGSTGAWTLVAASGVVGREHGSARLSTNLSSENGHLVLRLNGVSADGRRSGSNVAIASPTIAGRELAMVVDTLLFALGGVVRARLAVGTPGGTVNIYGDVEMRGDGTSRNSGNLSGYIDATSKVGSATDRNSKGPWTWRP